MVRIPAARNERRVREATDEWPCRLPKSVAFFEATDLFAAGGSGGSGCLALPSFPSVEHLMDATECAAAKVDAPRLPVDPGGPVVVLAAPPLLPAHGLLQTGRQRDRAVRRLLQFPQTLSRGQGRR